MARNKPINRAFGRFGQAVLFEGGLSRRNVELAVLRMGWNCQAVYEFGQHTLFGRDAGLDRRGDLLRHPAPQPARLDRRGAQPSCKPSTSSTPTTASATPPGRRASAHFDDAEMIHLVMAAGCYRVVSGFLNSCGVQLDEGVPGWPTPPDGRS